MPNSQDSENYYKYYYKSPIGFIELISTQDTIIKLDFVDEDRVSSVTETKYFPEIILTAVSELDQYFEGKLKEFTVKLEQEATQFRKTVYRELVKIPYGETISYRELASRIGKPKAARAVGGANHNNNIVIIVPCHRVIGADGSLVGYGGGLDRKKYLLELERRSSSALV